MKRGVWRWWRERNGADEWFARVENEHGQFTDVDAARYEAEGYQPTFWSLPIKEEHIEDVLYTLAGSDAKERAIRWASWDILLLAGLAILWGFTNLRWL